MGMNGLPDDITSVFSFNTVNSTELNNNNNIGGGSCNIEDTAALMCENGTLWDQTTFFDRLRCMGVARSFADQFNKCKFTASHFCTESPLFFFLLEHFCVFLHFDRLCFCCCCFFLHCFNND